MDIFDPLRHKQVTATPEEQVRQWMIGELGNVFQVPLHMMNSEVGFTYGGKRYRPDILIFDRDGSPLAVVECKRPDVPVDARVAGQVNRYNLVLSVRYVILTNGNYTYIYRREGEVFAPMDHIPTYEEMICRQ